MKRFLENGIRESLKGQIAAATANINIMMENVQFSSSVDAVGQMDIELGKIATAESKLAALSDLTE